MLPLLRTYGLDDHGVVVLRDDETLCSSGHPTRRWSSYMDFSVACKINDIMPLDLNQHETTHASSLMQKDDPRQRPQRIVW